MNKKIRTGVCLFALILSLMLPAAGTVIAQSGHGGSTQVIAHIEKSPAESSEESRPSQESSEPTDDKPAKTGDTALPLFLSMVSVFCCAAIVVVARDKKRKS